MNPTKTCPECNGTGRVAGIFMAAGWPCSRCEGGSVPWGDDTSDIDITKGSITAEEAEACSAPLAGEYRVVMHKDKFSQAAAERCTIFEGNVLGIPESAWICDHTDTEWVYIAHIEGAT